MESSSLGLPQTLLDRFDIQLQELMLHLFQNAQLLTPLGLGRFVPNDAPTPHLVHQGTVYRCT